MVDYSTVRADYPSITFFFTHLGSLLESIEGERLERISSFEGLSVYFYPFFLISFRSCSDKVARLLRMSEVRSSDLEIGLSSFDDHVVSEATSVSTPYKGLEHIVFSLRKG